eukprot:CAMPEP_0181059980 /NCGR_PEP_ID=MMETSP1070-20121207/21700_1 /TAXON_ID=265543 /ORGANISM="Minutocellus polymorphus, Strain NH13" /LENGTH=357 /DNA_ID=CAMNT_0023139751 /DNA_START=127 /DNA_END=1201 /DNA_ORIENTATION=+
MPSLTPQHRAEETADHAFRDGMLSGLLALVPSSAGVYAAMQNKKFVRSTNWQSRTALIIMPPLFMFAFSSESKLRYRISSESKLRHRMEQMAHEADHSRSTAEWAEEHGQRTIAEENARIARASSGLQRMHTSSATTDRTASELNSLGSEDVERQLTELYNQSVQNSGVRIVPGDQLGPIKILAGIGIPTVLYIFKGRNDKAHLQLQSKLMHTRVYGQGVVVFLLLGLMGVKGYLDSMGQYITEAEANERVEDMRQMRLQLKERLARDKRLKMEERERVLRGKKENSMEHQTRERQLQNVDDFEAQMEQEQENSGDDQPKSKKPKKKKKKKVQKALEGPVIVIINEDEAEKLVEDES